jgi:hypothetical protein
MRGVHETGSGSIADVDGDGSAEILVVAGEPGEQTVYALGPANGRWARTRPVWNQLAYDVTSIRDDGTIIATPLPPSTTYGGVFRAQPAHDGLKADLSTEARMTCASDTTVILDFAVHNQGSVDAPAGTVLALRSFDGTVWSELTTSVVADAIPAGSLVTGTITVDAADLGTRLVLEARGTGEECDLINDRSKEILR